MDIRENVLIAYVHHFTNTFEMFSSVFLPLYELHKHCELRLWYGYLALSCIIERVRFSSQSGVIYIEDGDIRIAADDMSP